MDAKKLLENEELEKVNGGSYLSSDEVKSLVKGQKLIFTDDIGDNVAEVEYLGEYRDPGMLLMLQCRVKILKWIGNKIELFTFDSPSIHIGDVVWLPRWNLDLPERAK